MSVRYSPSKATVFTCQEGYVFVLFFFMFFWIYFFLPQFYRCLLFLRPIRLLVDVNSSIIIMAAIIMVGG